MDPLLGLGIAGAGYLLLRDKSKTPAPSEKEIILPPGIDLPIAIRSGMEIKGVGAANFHINPPVLDPSKYVSNVSASQIIGVITGTVGVATTALAIIGGGSASAGLTALGAGLASISAALGAAFVVLLFVIAITYASGVIGQDVDRLQHGRPAIRKHLMNIAMASANAVDKVIVGCTPSERTNLARMFGYLVARGYNRAAIQMAKVSGTWAIAYNANNEPEFKVGFWADRANCLPEARYIQSIYMYHPEMIESIFPGANADFREGMYRTEGSLEYELLKTTYDARVAEMGDKWSDEVAKQADFIGRAVFAQTYMEYPGLYELNGTASRVDTDSIQATTRLVDAGAIGLWTGVQEDAMNSNTGIWQAAMGRPKDVIDAENRLVHDHDGKSGLAWYYNESWLTHTAVVREDK